MIVPILMITYNRLEYTKLALAALQKCKGCRVYIIDNGSTDGTVEYLRSLSWWRSTELMLNAENLGIAGAMQQFLNKTKWAFIVGKVDNDTIVAPDFIERMLPHMDNADIVQAKHPLIKATHSGGFDDWVKDMPQKGSLRYNHFVGGSGVLFRRDMVNEIPETEWKLGGWREFQRRYPKLQKAFAMDVEIKLLDTDENGADYSQYPDYYLETGRIKP